MDGLSDNFVVKNSVAVYLPVGNNRLIAFELYESGIAIDVDGKVAIDATAFDSVQEIAIDKKFFTLDCDDECYYLRLKPKKS